MELEYHVDSLIIMAGLIAFLGFCLENIWLLFTKGYIDNRNMTLPFLLGYGLGALAFYLVLGTPGALRITAFGIGQKTRLQKYLLYYLIAFVSVSVGEILLGTAVEKICGFAYWDYTRLPLHITKYTSVFTSLGFALAITLFMGKCFLPIMDWIAKIPPTAAKWTARTLAVLLLTDFAVSFFRMYRSRSLNVRWMKRFFPAACDEEEETSCQQR
ncbi:MAG: putative ABC transporter permease [Ruminococcus sp.]